MPNDNELQRDLEGLLDKLSEGDPERRIEVSARVIQALCDLHTGEQRRARIRGRVGLAVAVVAAVVATALLMVLMGQCGACISGALF